ncbi:MAG: hypothetical protein WBV61_09545 [Rhodanobacteraceae bacterium]
MALECSFSALASVDQTDPAAVQQLLDQCVATLLDPTLWAWAIGLNLACGVIGALLGWRKHRWVAGLVWGLALGPIGWLVIVLAKPATGSSPDANQVRMASTQADADARIPSKTS